MWPNGPLISSGLRTSSTHRSSPLSKRSCSWTGVRTAGRRQRLYIAGTKVTASQRVIDGVLNRQWDLGVVGITPDEALLHVQPYCRDTLVLIVPPSHRLAGQPVVTLADLVGETWILREEGSASGRLAEHALRNHHLEQGHTLVLQGSEGVKQAVMAELGICLLYTSPSPRD